MNGAGAAPRPKGPPRLWLCDGVEAALSGVASDRDEAAAVVVVGAGPEATVHVATMTPFGPSVWTSPRTGLSTARSIVMDTVKGGRDVYLHADARRCVESVQASARRGGIDVRPRPGGTRGGDVEEALERFRTKRASIDASVVIDGVPHTRSWAVAVDSDVAEVVHGDMLSLLVEPHGAGFALRWVSHYGFDGGLHLLVDRALTASESALVKGVRGRVVSFTRGRLPSDGPDETRTRLLSIDIPCTLARAFPDGRLPRNWILPTPAVA